MIPYVFTVLRLSPGYVDFYLDISKSLHTISHGILLEELAAGSLVRCAHCWVKNWMDLWAERVIVDEIHPAGVLSHVCHTGAQYWDQPFLMTINYLDKGKECTLGQLFCR